MRREISFFASAGTCHQGWFCKTVRVCPRLQSHYTVRREITRFCTTQLFRPPRAEGRKKGRIKAQIQMLPPHACTLACANCACSEASSIGGAAFTQTEAFGRTQGLLPLLVHCIHGLTSLNPPPFGHRRAEHARCESSSRHSPLIEGYCTPITDKYKGLRGTSCHTRVSGVGDSEIGRLDRTMHAMTCK